MSIEYNTGNNSKDSKLPKRKMSLAGKIIIGTILMASPLLTGVRIYHNNLEKHLAIIDTLKSETFDAVYVSTGDHRTVILDNIRSGNTLISANLDLKDNYKAFNIFDECKDTLLVSFMKYKDKQNMEHFKFKQGFDAKFLTPYSIIKQYSKIANKVEEATNMIKTGEKRSWDNNDGSPIINSYYKKDISLCE